ncbi:response regulator transcription factor [Salinimicrobium sp. GXAS 041]|uniref:response regulator transcription factor n=1 Tax=Salinimicrobium sp. GXAS 041 TaxID=3400806 RepID=UPI003C71957A
MKEIFIVEDDEGIRELIEFLLVSHNYSVKTFPSARSFQKIVPQEIPDLFLLDIMLPDGNGLDLCKDLKKKEVTKKIPVLLMSAHANINKLEGADDFIAKPFDIEELLQRIRKQLD